MSGDIVYRETEHFRGLQRVEPLAAFREAGATTGISSIELGSDQVARLIPQDGEALWRVVLKRHLKGIDIAAGINPGALVRYVRPSDLRHVSYYQALDPGALLPERIFRDKIVLVGLDLKTSPDPGRRHADSYATPFFRFLGMYSPGVEIHAQLIAGGYLGRSVTPMPDWLSWSIALLALAVCAAGMRRWRALWCSVLVVGVIAVVIALSILLFAAFDLWLPPSVPAAAAAMLYVARGMTAYLDELRRRIEIRRAFEFYVAPAVVKEMTTHPERLVLGGRRKELAVMFTDLAGFTSLAEGISPENVAKILNEHLTMMVQIILRHGGTIDKFIGDAVMAFWGAPLDDPEHSLHAIEAAIEMQSEMERWRNETVAAGGPALRMRIGINTGMVVVGNMGARDRFDYTVIGDAVNLASRLEGVNRFYGTEILLSEGAAAGVEGPVRLRRVDRVRVKGKQDAIEIFTIADKPVLGGKDAAAMLAYRAADWDRAQALWEEVVTLHPGDSIARLYLERIAQFRVSGVPKDWDGSFVLDQK